MADATDHRIADLINSYISKARDSIRKEGVDLVEAAFGMIRQDRQDKCLSDEIYSSAEHYLTARTLASSLTGGGMAVVSVGYDAVKFVFGSSNVQKLGLGNKCPASELTLRQTNWKLFGCVHGGRDMVMRGRTINPVNASFLEIATVTGVGGD